MYKRNRKIVFGDQPVPLIGIGSEGGINDQTLVLPTDGCVITFSTGRPSSTTTGVAVNFDATGNPTNVICIASGAATPTARAYAGGQFTLPNTSGYAFVMPKTLTLQSIYANASASAAVAASSTLGNRQPFIAIATAPLGSNVFTVNPYTITYLGPYPASSTTALNTWISGGREAIGVTVEAGTKVVIVGGLASTEATAAGSLTLCFNGGLFFN